MMSLKVVQKIFTYEEAKEFLTDYWYWNPQEIVCYEQKYFEIAENEPRLPKNPKSYFDNENKFFAYSSLFGESLFNFSESCEFCTLSFSSLPQNQKPTSLTDFYQKLRKIEMRLPASPFTAFKSYNLNWIGCVFSQDKADFFAQSRGINVNKFSYEEAIVYCQNWLIQNENLDIDNLNSIYQALRKSEPKLPAAPGVFYKNEGWVSFKVFFNIQNFLEFSPVEAVGYCSEKYNLCADVDKPLRFRDFYQKLRNQEQRLPASPYKILKELGLTYVKEIFGLKHISPFDFKETLNYCTQNFNNLPSSEKPESLHCFYEDLRLEEPRLPADPGRCFSQSRASIPISEFFGLEQVKFFTYNEAKAFCTDKYNSTPDSHKPRSLTSFYEELRLIEPKLLSSPKRDYKNHGWKSYREMFGLDKIEYFNYLEAQRFCSKKYKEISKKRKIRSLSRFYKELKCIYPMLKSCPERDYKGQGWVSLKVMFGVK